MSNTLMPMKRTNYVLVAAACCAGLLVAAYFNKKLEEGNARLDQLGDLSKQSFGNVKEAAKEAAKEVENRDQKYDEANKKEAQARAERDKKDAFDKELKDNESAVGIAAEIRFLQRQGLKFERDWTFKTGAIRRGSYVGFEGGNARIEMNDVIVVVPVINLNDLDQKIIKYVNNL